MLEILSFNRHRIKMVCIRIAIEIRIHKLHHIKARLSFAKRFVDKETTFWEHHLWSYETKSELLGYEDVRTICRNRRQAFHRKNTVPEAQR